MSGLQDPLIISFAELKLRSRFPIELNPLLETYVHSDDFGFLLGKENVSQ